MAVADRGTGSPLFQLSLVVDRLERRLAELERCYAALDRERDAALEPRRAPATRAAERLGISPATVRRLIESGALDGLALQLPDRERKLWVVDVKSLERFERESDPTGATGARNEAVSGRRPKATKG